MTTAAAEPYHVGGSTIALLLGRDDILKVVLGRLATKHVSIVGPKSFGKTVLVWGLSKLAIENGRFSRRLYWDLRHHIPKTDAEFYTAFSKTICEQLEPNKGELAAFFEGSNSASFEAIGFAFEYLREKGERVLLVLDGLDNTLKAGNLTKNLWDNLRSLSDVPELRFITGSRQPLQVLCSSPESKTSDFWNIFRDPIQIGALSDDDWNKFTAPLHSHDINLSPNGVAQLKHWTGGSPSLAAAVCMTAIESGFKGDAQSIKVDEWASSVESTHRDFINDLWDDCPAVLQGQIIEICSNSPYDRSKIPSESIQELHLRGYVTGNRDGLRCSNRFIENCAKRHRNVLPDIKRLFGAPEPFDKNVKALLELRLRQVRGADKELIDHISRAVQEVTQPHVSIAQMRNVANRALKIIWNATLKDRLIPNEWTEGWKFDGVQVPPSGKLPGDEGRQLQVLNLLTDVRKSNHSQIFSRSIYCLVGFLHSVGNLGQHQDSTPSIAFASCVCLAAIQLADELSQVFRQNSQAAPPL